MANSKCERGFQTGAKQDSSSWLPPLSEKFPRSARFIEMPVSSFRVVALRLLTISRAIPDSRHSTTPLLKNRTALSPF